MLTILNVSQEKLAKEFRLLINERFGPVGFIAEERTGLFAKAFPLRAVVKLVKLLENIRLGCNIKSDRMELGKDELGFYFSETKNELCSLYVGLWPELWETEHVSPICFGIDVDKVTDVVRLAFAEALLKEYGQEPISFDGYELGYIPEEHFDEDDALERIKPKLEAIWKSMRAF